MLLILGGLVLAGLALRLAVPRGIWLDEAISIHQARLSLHDLFQNLYNGDRQPPLYHLTLWATIRAFGHGELRWSAAVADRRDARDPGALRARAGAV